MTYCSRRILLWAAAFGTAAMALFLLFGPQQAFAHEAREAGKYNISFGWRVEPAFVGVPNGPELRLTLVEDAEKKIEGAEKTLKLQVKFGSQTRNVPIAVAWRDPGHYVADLTPTRPGDYVFRLTGTIGDEKVDETFTSADGKFGTVEPAGDILFPDTKLDAGSLQAEIDALKAQVESLKADVAELKK